jgi:hypothetical protein
MSNPPPDGRVKSFDGKNMWLDFGMRPTISSMRAMATRSVHDCRCGRPCGNKLRSADLQGPSIGKFQLGFDDVDMTMFSSG